MSVHPDIYIRGRAPDVEHCLWVALEGLVDQQPSFLLRAQRHHQKHGHRDERPFSSLPSGVHSGRLGTRASVFLLTSSIGISRDA